MSQVNRSNGTKVAHYQLPDTMRLCKADDFCDHPGHYPSLHCLLIYWADLYDSPLDSEASNCTLSPPSDATLLYIFPLLSRLYTIPPSRCMAIDRCLPLLVATGGSLLKARSTCVSQWQQYDLKPQVISHDLPIPPIPLIWGTKDTSTLVFFLHLLHS